MRPLQLVSLLFILTLLTSCATTERRHPQEQSIVDVLDSASFAPAMAGCGTNDVLYCISRSGGAKECACIDAQEMAYGAGGFFGH